MGRMVNYNRDMLRDEVERLKRCVATLEERVEASAPEGALVKAIADCRGAVNALLGTVTGVQDLGAPRAAGHADAPRWKGRAAEQTGGRP
jgi:hypothetical protein